MNVAIYNWKEEGFINKQYLYRPSILRTLLILLILAAAAAWAAYLAINGHDVSFRKRIIATGENAMYIYCAIAASAALFCLLLLFVFVRNRIYKLSVTLTDDAISFPNRFSRNSVTLYYRDINQVTVMKENGNSFLFIYHSNGKHRIAKLMLPRKDDFEDLTQALTRAISDSQ